MTAISKRIAVFYLLIKIISENQTNFIPDTDKSIEKMLTRLSAEQINILISQGFELIKSSSSKEVSNQMKKNYRFE